ncbi:hypothetical protein BC829DRAFT_218199 [Chytridium lagenaria]|nr:hypothetical protein BC829DRAFT_218199 [Chytridium lagenaria]
MLSTAPLPRGSVTLPIPEPPVTLSAATATTTTTAKLPVSGKNVPAFLNKLYNMVSDGSTNDLIHWSNDGTAFIVHRHEDFAREVLPRFFKHNNFSSFVRQLNMYGFHKIPHIQQGALYSDGEPEMWEFANPHFQKGQPDLLCLVTRKKGRDTDEKEVSLDLSTVLHEMSAIKRHQFSISSDLKSIQRENQILWSETVGLRERYVRQQQMIDRIVRFLASVVSAERPVVAKKRRLMLEDGTLAVAGESTSGKDTGTAGNAFLSSLLGESSVGEKRTLPGPLSDVQFKRDKGSGYRRLQPRYDATKSVRLDSKLAFLHYSIH